MNFITITNSGYNFFCDQQILNFSLDFMKKHNLKIFCADGESFKRLSNKQLPNNIQISQMDGVEITGLHGYLQGEFKNLMRLKFPLILKYLDGPLWFIDNDVTFVKDPDTDMYGYDILFQPDMSEEEHQYGWVCTGCFLVNDTVPARKFLQSLIDYQLTVDRGEQEALNDYCCSWPNVHVSPRDKIGSILNFKYADLNILPRALFQNGKLAFKEGGINNQDAIMFHYNHETNFETKKNNCKKIWTQFLSKSIQF